MTSRTLTRRAALAAAAVTTALVLSSCSGGGGDSHGGGHTGHGSSATAAAPGTSASPHNAQDVAFAQGMIPHHRQALEMAELAADRASSARVKDLAARIEKAQDPEIRTMTGWLKAWGEKTPAPGTDHTGHTGMSGMAGMSGMMSDADMDALRKADGKDFDTRFLALMVRHHQGAVEMAATEKDKGRSDTAKAMADAVVTAQSAEIKEMRQLLGTS
ncbi:DUF305 domain-containing protein [Streptomyces sp. SID161]|uniref:DUF305 domain-containing protein n=1 Tax=Streptomyces sp. SID161 TaxID=2690251 RepID=UPI0013705A0B|nr:DUF305 domain-containing protein [Streptomyces sp. SID161]MYW45455.1 DUF305 domain-containing protein [Streptomyces sp. SID161]